MIEIKRDTIIGDILDVAPQTAPHLPVDRHALPGLPQLPRRDGGRGLHGPRDRRGEAAGSRERRGQQACQGIRKGRIRVFRMRLIRSAKGGRRWKRNYSFSRGCNASQALCRRARDWPTSAPTMGIFPCGFCSTGASKAPLRLTSTRCRLTTRATAREYGVTERMDFRLCPGLAKIKAEECDAIAIAGMGGETILGYRGRALDA